MANWSTAGTRNIFLTQSSPVNRAYLFLSFMDHYLCEGAAGWTRIGSGGGTGSGLYGWGSTKVLPAYPAITAMATNAWSAWENASGAQYCLKVDNAGLCYAWWTPSGGFVSDSTTEAVPPSETGGFIPADMVTHTGGASYGRLGDNDRYFTMAYSDDHDSFIIFGRRTHDSYAMAFVKLEDTKTGDTAPYWGYLYSIDNSSAPWERGALNAHAAGLTLQGYHPTTGPQYYNVAELYLRSTFITDNIPADPVSGNIQLIESVCCCSTAGSVHIRGKLPGINRVSSVLGTGDRINDLGGGTYEYVVIGHYAVPWNSSDAMLW